MEFQSPFRLEQDAYERDIDIEDGYFEQMTHYIYTMTNGKYDKETIRANCEDMIKSGKELEHQYPMCKMWVRNQTTGDREEKYTTIDKLFKTVIKKEIISAPSFTFYLPEHVKRSKLSEFVEENVAKRARVKKEMFAAAAAGNKVLATNKKHEQNSVKTLNNAMSGAFSSPYTVIYNQSSHSVLTSTCRTATSFGNAANERVLGGRRHYDNANRVIDHFLSIATLTDFDEFMAVMNKHQLHVPSVEETMDVIRYSATDYFRNDESMKRIEVYVSRVSDMERAAFVYMGDLFHLAKYNDEFMRGFIGKLIAEYKEEGEITDWDAAEKSIDGDMKIIISQFRPDIIPLGKSFGDVKLRDKETKVFYPWEQQDKYKELIRSALYLQKSLGEYTTFIKAILTNKNLPINIARMPDVIRHVGVVSDTDSTMATGQWWAKWYTGGYTGALAKRVVNMMIYIATQHMRHLMASMSVNMGVAKKRIFLYAMKNEFAFDAFALTTKAKHYFSIITGQEGQLKKDPELEVKGVSLRTSNVPPAIMAEFKRTIREICILIADGKKLELIPLLDKISALEHEVVDSVRSGKAEYLITGNIKDRSAYDDNDEKNYHYHRMYNHIFGPVYGYIDEPPYNIVKLPVNLENKTDVKKWLDSISDPVVKERATDWFERETDWRTYRTLQLPEHLVDNFGIPPDLIKAANVRRTAFATVEPYYHVLECLGVFMMDKHRERLLSDYYGESLTANDEVFDIEKYCAELDDMLEDINQKSLAA